MTTKKYKMTEQEKLKEFTWDNISIRKYNENDWVLILLTTQERADFIYQIISKVGLKLNVYIDKETRIYTICLVFRYNSDKELEFSFNTDLTSDGYTPLLLLNNGTVKFITTGVKSLDGKEYCSTPLLNLEAVLMPN